MQVVAVAQPLDRRDLAAVGLDREHRAALHGHAVHVHRAGAAVGRVAADVSARQAERVAQEVDEQQPRLDLCLARLAVHGHRDTYGIRH